ncbi:hypothetical protein LPL18_010485 [Halomonas sp. CUBES01]|uniref:Uncharacterized protein n=1 Tax=Vreelandella gomseomensis TaxID=370766 RepID=A0ABU1GDJ7_9GAMM|nr:MULTISPECIES: hypothetical protein [Halomonas]MDR5875556.1 hypothetical protein [Halomonas gomseomensis]MEC4767758.1 hypothetical protein [Halomonas sp. CUBES01]
MLFADSMSLLWLSYYGLSLIVLVAVYFAFAFLPRLPRLVLTWCIGGAMWAPAPFRLPLIEEGEFYTGWAPSAMVAAVGVMENNLAALRNGLLCVLLGVLIGAAVGVALWWRGRYKATAAPQEEEHPANDPDDTRRREPVIG